MTSSVPPEQQPQETAHKADESEHAVSDRQVKRLIRLAKDFDKAVDALPENKGKDYKREQKELADNRRRAQMSEGLLRMRVR